jgi:hypothetical protein
MDFARSKERKEERQRKIECEIKSCDNIIL